MFSITCGSLNRSVRPPVVGGARLTLVGPGVVQVEEDGNENVQHVATLQHEEQELLGSSEEDKTTSADRSSSGGRDEIGTLSVGKNILVSKTGK